MTVSYPIAATARSNRNAAHQPSITVTLGDLQEHVEARVKSGKYASSSEVLRAAVRALDREEAALSDWLRQRVEEAFADPRPNVPARKVFKRLRDLHAGRPRAGRNEDV
ncbi:MAG: type II toxin-antitoxin system ParD family antitoxin [Hyphomicrobiales bacterium]